MADPLGIQSPFPAPPPYWQTFTTDNLKRLRQSRKESAQAQGTSGEDGSESKLQGSDALSLPAGLRTLVPPEPPADGKFTIFGLAHDLREPEPTLSEAGIEQLYPVSSTSETLNPQPHLLALTRSMLTTFLALTGVLSQNPMLQEEKTKDLQTMAFNIHDLVNKYRPHQARETLILMMEERVEKMRGEVKEIREMRTKVKDALDVLKLQGEKAADAHSERLHEEDQEFPPGKTGMEGNMQGKQKVAWKALEQEMGEVASGG
ncbi:hypothetical protein K431DRAFT_280198 [Polychaeton citri CBS 116435]|uniref:Mediator of RNA polymerase II transcription subunit 7 n=1 Tax=Polychaeton citri CBS 116435 TaxID=1314669 RepID=A0A9P4QI44_9PEZI|nr:hypothetical protein K431DRAFT_280198 [Polychaeton citri CBS 116435]